MCLQLPVLHLSGAHSVKAPPFSGDAAARLHVDRGCSSEDGPSLEILGCVDPELARAKCVAACSYSMGITSRQLPQNLLW